MQFINRSGRLLTQSFFPYPIMSLNLLPNKSRVSNPYSDGPGTGIFHDESQTKSHAVCYLCRTRFFPISLFSKEPLSVCDMPCRCHCLYVLMLYVYFLLSLIPALCILISRSAPPPWIENIYKFFFQFFRYLFLVRSG